MRTVVGTTVFFLCVVSAFSGCNSESSEPNQPEKPKDDRCDDLIRSALDMLQPDRFGITSDPEAAVGVLNQWALKCGTSVETGGSIDPEVMELLDGLVSLEKFNPSKNSNFNKRDVEHIRDCLLYKELVNSALKSARTDLERTVQLFDFVTRNIALYTNSKQPVPLTPFEIVLFGRGTPEERAWIFANLLRQLRIDAVILRPRRMKNASEDGQDQKPDGALPESHWLVGALLDGEVYLFDTQLGLPIPSKLDDGKTVTVRRPATLSEVLKNDAVFRILDVDSEKPYPLTSDDFRNVQVAVIGNGGFWFPKMKKLQISMTGESVLIYDGLEDDEVGDGLVSRVAKYGDVHWKRNDLSFWAVPERALQNSATLSGIQRQKLMELHQPFETPYEINSDPANKQDGPLQIGQPSRKQLKTRADHILGRLDKVISRYQLLRLELHVAPGFPGSPEIRLAYGKAQEDAFFWTGVCQIEQGKFTTAAETLQSYLSRYSRRGAWANQAIYLLSLSLAQSNKLALAMQPLSTELDQDFIELDPLQRLKYHFLVNRWRALRKFRRSVSTKKNE